MRRTAPALESLVTAVILLALAHTFLDDLSLLSGWSVAVRRPLIWAGFGIDLFFTVEFLTRLFLAISGRRTLRYLFQERGWIDFFASVPLLLFTSVPSVLTLLQGAAIAGGLGSTLNILKVAKALRIARVLRLLRIVKVFRNIRAVGSLMAQRHVATITTIGVSVLVFWLLGASFLGSTGILTGLDREFRQRHARYAASLAEATSPAALAERVREIAAVDREVLAVRSHGVTLFSRHPEAYYASRMLPGEYGWIAQGGIEVFVDERPLEAQAARDALIFFGAVLLIVLAYLFLYSPQFAMRISDPIHVMKRGMGERDYSLEVRIPEARRDDDVFELAALYNGVFLPLKDRQREDSPVPALALSEEDVKSLVGGG
jgi:hypothetical protein